MSSETLDLSPNGKNPIFPHWLIFPECQQRGKNKFQHQLQVKLAKKWKPVPAQLNCTTATESPAPETAVIAPQDEQVYELDASKCDLIKHLEHMQVSMP